MVGLSSKDLGADVRGRRKKEKVIFGVDDFAIVSEVGWRGDRRSGVAARAGVPPSCTDWHDAKICENI